MSKNIRIISSLFLAAFILYGCSSTPKKEDTLTKTAESTQQDTVAS
jgi:PBP1b-binding outer membrane lipoprotein LpoB